MKGDANQSRRTTTLAVVLCATVLLAALIGLCTGCSPQGPQTTEDKGSASSAPAPTQADGNGGEGGMDGQPVNWTMDIDCAICHTSEAEGRIERQCALVAAAYKLTPRESEVVVLLAYGRTLAIIARDLQIAKGTARTHIESIYRKLGVHKQQELIDLVEGFQA